MSKEYPFTENISPTVKKYKKAYDACDNNTAVRDILTDLLHFCAKHKIDFDQRLEVAKEVFDIEVDGEE